MNTCESCKLPTYDWGYEASPQGGNCRECHAGICARPGCAAEPVEICCEECACTGLCWECASLAWCPELPAAILAANLAESHAQVAEYNRKHGAAKEYLALQACFVYYSVVKGTQMKQAKASKVVKKAKKLMALANALGPITGKDGTVKHSKAAAKLGAKLSKLALELHGLGVQMQLHLAVSA